MGLFSRKSMEQRQAEAMETAEKIGQGKGFVGKLTKLTMGSGFTESVGNAMGAVRAGQEAPLLMAQGAPTTQAKVTQVVDTGGSVNDNPIVVLVLDVNGASQQLQTMVSRLQIPRPGDEILLVTNMQTGQQLYGGIVPA